MLVINYSIVEWQKVRMRVLLEVPTQTCDPNQDYPTKQTDDNFA